MDVRRRLALGIATLGIALGAGHLVQNGRTQTKVEKPAVNESSERPSGIVVLSARNPAPESVAMTSAAGLSSFATSH
jgi:hypothetical protein